MYDLIIKGGSIVDGTGAPQQTGDVAVTDGLIVEVGALSGDAKQTIDADGLLVTPGWVDIHTHYDGQVTWDPLLTPSFWQGVTTAVMGNCGVGFAPAARDGHDFLIGLMEGVEDIPGAALAAGVKWDWETFPEYLDAVERHPHAMDVGCQIAHGPVRAYVMGQRGAKNEPATPEDIEKMATVVTEALQAGALGFTTSRTLLHLAVDGEPVPGTWAREDELMAMGHAIAAAGHGIFELAPAGISGDDLIAPAKEMAWMRKVAKATGVPVTFLFGQNNKAPDAWRDMLKECEAAAADGARVYPQVFGRPTTLLFSFQGPNQFIRFPTYATINKLPAAEKLARLRDPEVRAKILAESDPIQDAFADMVQDAWAETYVMGDDFDFEPPISQSVQAVAAREGRDPRAVAYDEMLRSDGTNYLMFCGLNYSHGNLDALHEQLIHPLSIIGGGDGGAHVSYICDANVPTFLMTHWARDRSRGPRIAMEAVVKKLTSETATLYGLNDRGVIAPCKKADFNLIDFDRLNAPKPFMVNDLPTGAQRLMATAEGYVKTIVAGEVVQENGKETGARPGKLIRGKAAA
ncbi:MAG: amidohydrolase family protein [Proteobacteria bacterium]|nr:amidohydrolase family protein [Pseudomonadota bacterium]MDA1057359.1 amidohydrolase family protein [Pseudomonadota bacterium]